MAGTIEITVRGDLDGEFDEHFRVPLTNGRDSADPPSDTPPRRPRPDRSPPGRARSRCKRRRPSAGRRDVRGHLRPRRGHTGSVSGSTRVRTGRSRWRAAPRARSRPSRSTSSAAASSSTRPAAGTALARRRPRTGDVVRFVVGGVDRAATTFDGKPSLDVSCEAIGKRTVNGQVSPGSVLTFGAAVAVTRNGDNFTVVFPLPLTLGQGVLLSTRGEHTLAIREHHGAVRVLATVCGSGPPPSSSTRQAPRRGRSPRGSRSLRRRSPGRSTGPGSARCSPAGSSSRSSPAEGPDRDATRALGGKGGSVVVARGDRAVDCGHTSGSGPVAADERGRRLLRPRAGRPACRSAAVDGDGRALRRSSR